MKKMISKHKKIIIFIMTVFSLSVFFLNLEIIPNKNLVASDTISKFFEKIFKSINGYDILSIPIFICIYYMYNKLYFKSKLNKAALIISICMSITHVLGYSFYKYNSWKVLFGDSFQFFKSIIVIIGLIFIFYLLIKKLYEYIDNIK